MDDFSHYFRGFGKDVCGLLAVLLFTAYEYAGIISGRCAMTL